jgi:hypothetical protein
MATNSTRSTATNNLLPEWVEPVRKHVESIRYGNVQLVVHEGHVVQIEVQERIRLPLPGRAREEA